jgi:hypothetical protein
MGFTHRLVAAVGLFGDPNRLTIQVFAFSLTGTRPAANQSFVWRGMLSGTLVFPTPSFAVNVFVVVPFPMSPSNPARFIFPPANSGTPLTLDVLINTLPSPITVNLGSIGIEDTLNSIAVTDFSLLLSSGSRRRAASTGVSLTFFKLALRSTKPWSMFDVLNVESFSLDLVKVYNASLTGWVNGTISFGSSRQPVDLAVPVPLRTTHPSCCDPSTLGPTP